MLHDFLLAERDGILALCGEKNLSLAASRTTSDEMEKGLPVFYDELIEVLRADANSQKDVNNKIDGSVHRASAVRRGKESLKLGYTISQVVHGYGALCQAITQYIDEKKIPNTSAREFNRLNFCLDVAIAEAVTAFDQARCEVAEREEVQRLGFLAHELRNALGNAGIAYRMIKSGHVGAGGNTAQILEEALARMRDLIDRSLTEVRLRGEPNVQFEKLRVFALVSEVEVMASFEANAKSIKICIKIPPTLEVSVDHHLITSALSNLIQNAIKFTKPGKFISIRALQIQGRVLIEIEDQCGGLPDGKAEELFQPFTQKGADRSGLGLGLTIARRAIALNNGTLSVRNIPQHGCVFSIDLPQALDSPDTGI